MTDRIGGNESRRATNCLFAVLHSEGPMTRRVMHFVVATAIRSAEQVAAHPRAGMELTALHGLLLAVRRPGGHRWILISWALAVTHLGLLGPRRSIGTATTLTFLRATAPAVRGAGAWTGLAAVASDRADGALARRAGPTQFGHYADSMADAAFWTWFALRYEVDPRWRAAALGAWILPVAGITAASFAQGRMIDPPRSTWARPAAALQGLLAWRAVSTTRHPRCR